MPGDASNWLLDPGVVRAQVAERVRVAAGFLIGQATAQTLDELGQGDAAHEVLERRLRQD